MTNIRLVLNIYDFILVLDMYEETLVLPSNEIR